MTSERQRLKTRAHILSTLLTAMFVAGLILYVNAEAPWRYVGMALLAMAFSAVASLVCTVATR